MISKLKLIRVLQDIKQKEVARRTGYSQSYISGVETGAVRPSNRLIKKLAEILPISAEELK